VGRIVLDLGAGVKKYQGSIAVDSMTYFDPAHEHSKLYPYTSARFTTEEIRFNDGLRNGLTRSFLVRFANRLPGAYERWISHLFPLDQLTFTLRVEK